MKQPAVLRSFYIVIASERKVNICRGLSIFAGEERVQRYP